MKHGVHPFRNFLRIGKSLFQKRVPLTQTPGPNGLETKLPPAFYTHISIIAVALYFLLLFGTTQPLCIHFKEIHQQNLRSYWSFYVLRTQPVLET